MPKDGREDPQAGIAYLSVAEAALMDRAALRMVRDGTT